uniref:Uncharacterized protein n=1 Tax=Peronospora matthiolae TaxID=2874970 RepID=A0AAV1V2R2_9STRA
MQCVVWIPGSRYSPGGSTRDSVRQITTYPFASPASSSISARSGLGFDAENTDERGQMDLAVLLVFCDQQGPVLKSEKIEMNRPIEDTACLDPPYIRRELRLPTL